MKEIRKKLAALVLAAVMAIPFMPDVGTLTAYAMGPIEADAQGTTGTCTWSLEGTGVGKPITMFITAKNSSAGGVMADYDYDNKAPWYKYRDKIEAIEFKNVVHVGDYAFHECYNLPDVYIDNVKQIGSHAFYACPALTNITIDGHENGCVIEESAFGESMDFDNKTGSGKIDLTNVTSIGDDAFEECDAEVDLRDKLQHIGAFAFAHNCKLEEIMIPRGCTQIDNHAFYDNASLRQVYLPEAKCTIGQYAFEKKVTLYCKKSSTALSYAKANGCDYRFTGNMGAYTLDLRKGSVTMSFTDIGGTAYPLVGGLILNTEVAENTNILGLTDGGTAVLYDLDKNGKADLVYRLTDLDDNIMWKRHAECSVKNRITLKLNSSIVKAYEDRESFYSSITVIFDKYSNPLIVKAKTAKVKRSKLRKKNQVLAVNKVIKFTRMGQGKMSFALSSAKKGSKSFKKYFKINSSTGKVTIKKNKKMTKGIYKVRIRVMAAGNANYKPSAVKTVICKIKVQ